MKYVLKVAAAVAVICLCRIAIEKIISHRMIREMESYLESVGA